MEKEVREPDQMLRQQMRTPLLLITVIPLSLRVLHLSGIGPEKQ